MKKKLLIGLGAVVGIILIIAVIATVTSPGESATPTLTASEQAYTTAIVEHSSKVSTAMSELGSLMSESQIGDDEWTFNVAVQLATIRVLYDEAVEIEPPSSMTDIHYNYMQAMRHYDTATHLLAEGIDKLDADLISQATAEMESGTQFIDEATRLTKEFGATKS